MVDGGLFHTNHNLYKIRISIDKCRILPQLKIKHTNYCSLIFWSQFLPSRIFSIASCFQFIWWLIYQCNFIYIIWPFKFSFLNKFLTLFVRCWRCWIMRASTYCWSLVFPLDCAVGSLMTLIIKKYFRKIPYHCWIYQTISHWFRFITFDITITKIKLFWLILVIIFQQKKTKVLQKETFIFQW